MTIDTKKYFIAIVSGKDDPDQPIRQQTSNRINMKVMRWVAAALFVILGILSLFAPTPEV